jgi:hypothetical protein
MPAFAAVLRPALVDASWPGCGREAELVSSGSERDDVVASEVVEEGMEDVNPTLEPRIALLKSRVEVQV